MKAECHWNGKKNFITNINGFKVHIDVSLPLGMEKIPTIKQLVLASFCGRAGMFVINMLTRSQNRPSKFRIDADSRISESYPYELKEIKLKYFIEGDCSPDVANEAVVVSQNRYCAISAMVSQGTSIDYEIWLNNRRITGAEYLALPFASRMNDQVMYYEA
tara:strand:- start:4990 stop:5472 length:483 start_codon:yes stop_codon:yes gene_type:complete